MSKIKILFTLSIYLFSSLIFAANGPLDLVLTQGITSGIPIAVVPFSGQDNFSNIIQADLQNSGQFKLLDNQQIQQNPHKVEDVALDYWRQTKVNAVVIGNVQPMGDQYQVSFSLVNVFQNSSGNKILASKTLTISPNQMRAAAHHFSDMIYQAMTGVRGVFSTRIAYVLVQRNPGQKTRYSLQVADMDGYNPRPLLNSKQPIMSPAWSHDGRRIAYVSFENITPQIFVQDVINGSRHAVSNFPGINGAPAWSPDNSQLALVLSKTGNPKIYILNLASGQLKQVTQGSSIDTEPNWAPDGKSLIFTSDRGGGPQVYKLTLSTGEAQRITFSGNYNARASYTADGQSLVMIHKEEGQMYNIAKQDLNSGTLQVLSRSGFDASPSVAPNGKMVLFESDASQKGILGMISMDGKIKLHVPSDNGSVQDPAWSPFLS